MPLHLFSLTPLNIPGHYRMLPLCENLPRRVILSLCSFLYINHSISPVRTILGNGYSPDIHVAVRVPAGWCWQPPPFHSLPTSTMFSGLLHCRAPQGVLALVQKPTQRHSGGHSGLLGCPCFPAHSAHRAGKPRGDRCAEPPRNT